MPPAARRVVNFPAFSVPTPSTKKIDSTAALARHLSLSRWTVSRAINGHKEVNPETARRITEAMKELGFTPSLFGRGLRGGRTGLIGIAVRHLETPIIVRKITALQRSLQRHRYKALWEMINFADEGVAEATRHFLAMRVEGVLLVDAPLNPAVAAAADNLHKAGIPCVRLDPLGPVRENAVSLDREDATAQIVTYLHRLGHRRFGLLGIDGSFPFGLLRHNGIVRALEALGESPERCVKIYSQPKREFDGYGYGQDLAGLVLRQKARPTALIALNDEVALGAMWTLQRAGVKVPEELSLFGFDNLPASEKTIPAICTVDQQVPAMIDATVDLLLRLIQKPALGALPGGKVVPRLIIRDSVAPPA